MANRRPVMDPTTREALRRVLLGDAQSLVLLQKHPQDELFDGFSGTDLIIGREAVARVLHGIEKREIDGATAQRWASFVRRGYVAGKGNRLPLKPLSIEYEPSYEDQIAEILSRLDEIGDLVDGDVPGTEKICEFLASLGFADDA
jgi:hypothetical protein